MTVTVHVAPQRRHPVDVRVAIDVVEIGPAAPVDDQRRLLLAPAELLGERVPDVPAVRVLNGRGGVHGKTLARGSVGTVARSNSARELDRGLLARSIAAGRPALEAVAHRQPRAA